ncbi:ATP-binding protein [Allokutzneria oryzae]|uniref:ATP-binding protein n=1 Tax=Allokutzneria oryzae TaxID=1378989 RepID=A0ABV5ZXA6_9PSEU
MLRPLGMTILPRRIALPLCQDVVARLHRATGHTARHAALALTSAVRRDLALWVFADQLGGDLPAPERSPEEIWGPALLRLTLWVAGKATIQDARLWQWAAGRPWFSASGGADPCAAVHRAAERVVHESAAYRFQPKPSARSKGSKGESTADDQPPREVTETVHTEDNVGPLPDTSVESERDESTKVDLRTACEALDGTFAEALTAARRVVESLAASCPPARDDLTVLVSARSSFDLVINALGEAGAEIEEESSAAVREAVDQIAAASQDGDVRTSLTLLCSLTVADNDVLLAQLASVRAEAMALLALREWGEADRTSATVLGTLVSLAEPTVDVQARMEAIQLFTTAKPEFAALAVQASLLVLNTDGTDAGSQADADRSAPDQSIVDELPGPQRSEESVAAAGREETNTVPAETIAASAPVPVERQELERPVLSETVLEHSRLVATVADLVAAQRFGMAALLATADKWPVAKQSVLRVAALADVVHSEKSACAIVLRRELSTVNMDDVVGDLASVLLAIPALVRAALVTGDPNTGALLGELSNRVEPNLADLAEQVGRRALQGALVGSPVLTVLADVNESERVLRDVTDKAAQVLRRHRSLRFKRATDIAKAWLAADGMLGRPLTLVVANNQSAVNEVSAALATLSDSSAVTGELDLLDRKLRGSGGKPVEGAGRQALLNLVQEALRPLAEWTETVLSLTRANRRDTWSTGEITAMREALLTSRPAVVEALMKQAQHSDRMVAAAARAAIGSLTMTFSVLEGKRALLAREPAPELVLTGELLKVPGASIDLSLSKVTAPENTTSAELVVAAERDWNEAIGAQIEAENYAAARFVLDAVQGGGISNADRGDAPLAVSEAELDAAERASREELTARYAQLTTELRQALLNAEITHEQDNELAGLLNDAAPTGQDLGAARIKLERVAEEQVRYRTEAVLRLQQRLADLPNVDEATIERVTGLINTGQLSTAEELTYFLEIGVPVPKVRKRKDFGQYFPTVPDALPRGLTPELIAVIRSSRQVRGCEVLNFSKLSSDVAATTAEALSGWLQMSTTPPEGRWNRINERQLLLPALRVIGIECRRIERVTEVPHGPNRRFVDVCDIKVHGSALVPAFSEKKLNKRLRVLLAWGQHGAEQLMGFADQDHSEECLLIAYFGTMSMQTRQELARRAVRSAAPVLVLDDSALAYLAAQGNGQMDATMSVLLPFSNVNPYLRQKRGLVAEEMFYGRDAERKSLLDPDGTQLIFGGRGLGKSALLRNAAARFEDQKRREHVAIYLSLDTVGIAPDSAIGSDAIWGALARDLIEREVITRPRGRKSVAPYEQVRSGLLEWTKTNPQRRLLILLDECDRFFEADAPRFSETTRLKHLGESANSKVKVVFAGLHSVQRYTKSSPNGPFSHLAQRPTVIGPLHPQFASDLLTSPLQALGFEFAEPDFVNRVLGYCSYQPFLLQMFGNRLIEAMHVKRATVEPLGEGPPFKITRADVESVEANADLKADINAAFRDTLHLDPRYNVIANVLAHNAHESGLDARLTDVQVREECLGWWPAGFTTLDIEGFRAYLQEMVGLGVLAPNNDGRGWHLRSPNVLSMIGSRKDVETQLVGADTSLLPEEFTALEQRMELADGRWSPLTARQVNDLVGVHTNQVRVVLGTPATRIEMAATGIRKATGEGGLFTVPSISMRRHFEEELIAGKPGERRVIIDDLVVPAPNDEACLEALAAAVERVPTVPGVTRSAVIIAGPDQFSVWRAVLGGATAKGTTSAGVVLLRRYDRASLRVWTLSSGHFSHEERFEKLLEVTGGWPMLVEEAAMLVSTGRDEQEALRRVAERLAQPEGAAALVDAVGLTAEESLLRAFEAVVVLADLGPISRSDLLETVEEVLEEPETTLDCLIALQLFDIDAEGRYELESRVLAAWPHRTR